MLNQLRNIIQWKNLSKFQFFTSSLYCFSKLRKMFFYFITEWFLNMTINVRLVWPCSCCLILIRKFFIHWNSNYMYFMYLYLSSDTFVRAWHSRCLGNGIWIRWFRWRRWWNAGRAWRCSGMFWMSVFSCAYVTPFSTLPHLRNLSFQSCYPQILILNYVSNIRQFLVG